MNDKYKFKSYEDMILYFTFHPIKLHYYNTPHKITVTKKEQEELYDVMYQDYLFETWYEDIGEY